LGVLRDFSRVADALERLASSAAVMRHQAPALDRLEALELSRAQFEADIEGVLMKAEGKLKAASNAEARERTMQKGRLDPFDSEGAADEEAVRYPDAPVGQEEEMHPLHMDLAPGSKAYALRAKFLG